MRFRKLRIAWSLTWGVVAALLFVLWVRSYWYADSVISVTATGSSVRVTNFNGSVEYIGNTRYFPGQRVEWRLAESPENAPLRWIPTKHGFAWVRGAVIIPYWSAFVLSTMLCTVVWVPWSRRFSLRTLLIATTLVAALLGLIIWLR